MRGNAGRQFDISLRLGGFYGAVCLYSGIATPYWPVWLKSRGLSPTEIALLLAAPYLVRILAGPLIGSAADRHGDHKQALLLLLCGALCTQILFFAGHDFQPILALTVLSSIFFPAVLALMEVVTLQGCQHAGLDYARVRVSGSASFMICSTLIGYWLDRSGAQILLPGTLIMLGLALYAATWLPRLPRPKVDAMAIENAPAPDLPAPILMTPVARPLRDLLTSKTFLLFASSGGLLQASHGAYYAFGTLNWQAQGYSSVAIGALWALGVIAEITLFMVSKPLVAAMGPAWLMVIGGCAGVVRWSATALEPPAPITWAMQLLHALSFGASHLGAMHFIQRAVPRSAAASAQTLYQLLFMSVAFGIVTLAAGPLFERYGAGLFWLSAGLSASGAAFGVALLRNWKDRR